MTNKFKIENLDELKEVNLSSDDFIVEKDDKTHRTTLYNISHNTVFDILRTNALEVNGVNLKGFQFKGKGRLVDDETIYDIELKKNITAKGNAGWIYQVETSGTSKIYASNGTNWVDFGINLTNASKSDYGVVKIGDGINVQNGVISTNGSGNSTSFVWWDHASPPPIDKIRVYFSTTWGEPTTSHIEVEEGQRIGELPNVIGYDTELMIFCGWYTEQDGGEEIDKYFTPTADTTLYARFVDKTISLEMINSSGLVKMSDEAEEEITVNVTAEKEEN